MLLKQHNVDFIPVTLWSACHKTKEALKIRDDWHIFISTSVREWPVWPQQWHRLPSSYPPAIALGARLLLLIQWGWVLRCWWVLPEQHFPQTLLRVSRESPRLLAVNTAQSRSVASEFESSIVVSIVSNLSRKNPAQWVKISWKSNSKKQKDLWNSSHLYLHISSASFLSFSYPQSLRGPSGLAPH